MIVALLCVAGGVGAGARFVLDGALRSRTRDTFPWATLSINISGSLVLGLLTGLVLFAGAPDDVRLVLGTGFCGGYTTFSTASFETVRLVQQGAALRAFGYAAASVLGALAACAVGLVVASSLG